MWKFAKRVFGVPSPVALDTPNRSAGTLAPADGNQLITVAGSRWKPCTFCDGVASRRDGVNEPDGFRNGGEDGQD